MAAVVAQMVKNLPEMQENSDQSPNQEDHLEKWMATQFSILVWEIPWTEESDGLQSVCLQRVGNNWATDTFFLQRLAWSTLTLCLTEEKCLCSAHGKVVCPCPPVNRRLTHPFRRLAIPLEMFCKTEDPFTLLPQLPLTLYSVFDFSSSLPLSLWYIKEPGIQTQIRWLFWGTSLPSSQSAGSRIKVSSLPQHLTLSDSLACRAASRVSLDLVTLLLFR